MKKWGEVIIVLVIIALFFIVTEMAYQRYNCDFELRERCTTSDSTSWCMFIYFLRPIIIIGAIWYLYHVIIGSDNGKKGDQNEG